MSDTDTEEFLDWLCLKIARSGERFYPPDESAEECMEAVQDQYQFDNGDFADRLESVIEYRTALAYEEANHSRAWLDAVQMFVDMRRNGFDPKKRAERHRERKNEGWMELSDIDWTWLEESHYNTVDGVSVYK